MSHTHTNQTTSPYDPPVHSSAVATPPLISKDRIFFGVAATATLPLSVWYAKEAISYGQRGMPNDHLIAISSGTLALGLFLVSAAAFSLAARISRFGESQRSALTRIGSLTAVALLTLWGGLLASGGARQGIFLFVSCAVWACASIYERNRQDHNAVTPVRWVIRTIAAVLALPMLGGGASLVFDAINLFNKLHLKSPFPVFNRMPANIPESDVMIYGALCIGIPFLVIGVLLLHHVFRGFIPFGRSPSVPK